MRSVLDQSFQDFELIVVGDCCTDDTERVIGAFRSERVTWLNLPQRSGSQAGPNNAGIELARGRYVVYIGHDDVWAPDHLATLHRCFLENPDAAFVIAGCIYHGPPGSGFYIVTGMFEPLDDQAPRKHFFPPSSIAHRREITARIGPWRKPEQERAPVDAEFSLRAFSAGLRFHPTGQITVHKFAGGHRYLSYLQMDSSEQVQLLRMMSEPSFPAFVRDIVQRSRESGRYMVAAHPDYARYAPGQITEANRKSKGILRPPLQALTAAAHLEQMDNPAAIDWQPLKTDRHQPYRWSGPNPRPKLLLPFTSPRRVDIRFDILGMNEDALNCLHVRMNDRPVKFEMTRRPGMPGASVICCRTRLRRDDYSIVEFDLTGGMALDVLVRNVTGVPPRMALGSVSLAPVSWISAIWPNRPPQRGAISQSA
ncbi:glycosyltransferase family 2 protein [Dongia deserti]|uniref:glycosyltransferase family 2 protein n=1 Tax=Dongia deserti TaxID=2268030 RepID=UPI002547EF18|nr:glycosyltransferase family A protein [Dongia deserti]